ncbi:MAG: FAD:protein FMN transferase [Methylococcaceae bacterium]
MALYPPSLNLYRFAFKAMGSPCDVQLYAPNKTLAKQVADTVIADVQRLEQRYSRYRADSELSAINRVAAVGGSINVDAETASLLNYADTCYKQSDGLFDVSSGILRRAWRFDSGQLPEKASIDALLANIGWQKLRWNAPVLEFLQAGMELDFGGIVKEYAVDRAAALCTAAGVKSGAINLGGDIRIIGPHPDGSPWQVGIVHPRNPNEVITSVPLFSGAMASSGDYERCLLIDGVRYGHVLNPMTGYPVSHLASVSVISDFCVVAGSASTIAMLKEKQGARWLCDLGLAHYWVSVDGEIGGSLLN